MKLRNRKIKIVLVVIISLVFVNYLLLVFFGKKSLISTVQENSREYILTKPFKPLIVYCNCYSNQDQFILDDSVYLDSSNIKYDQLERLSPQDKEKLIGEYQKQFDYVRYVEDLSELVDGQRGNQYFEYHLCYLPKYLFFVNVPEEVNLIEEGQYVYSKSRSTMYFWLYYRWVKIKVEDGGSS